jgi:hypothetical protein
VLARHHRSFDPPRTAAHPVFRVVHRSPRTPIDDTIDDTADALASARLLSLVLVAGFGVWSVVGLTLTWWLIQR